NPLSSDLDTMRQNMVYSVLTAVGYNQKRKAPYVKLFELGNTYLMTENGYEERQRLALGIAGNKAAEQWNADSSSVTFYNIKAAVDALIKRLNIENLQVVETSNIHLAYGLDYMRGQKVLVSVGAVHADALKKTDVNGPVYFAEFDWDLVLKSIRKNTIKYKEVSKFPTVRRDLALLIDDAVTFDQLKNIAFKSERKLLREVSIFDVYKGDKLPAGKKSYALSFSIQDEEKTLNDKQIDSIINKLILNFEKETGAVVRYGSIIWILIARKRMASLSAQMDVIVEKTKNLIQLCEALQEENDLLKLELQSVQVAFETSSDKIVQLEEKVKALTIAKSLEDAEVDKEAINEKILDTKQKINDFVREIDRCINLLK